MFPLGAPLLPNTGVPLHVFEDRYREMVADCMEGDRRFGVVLIERGSEVGGGDVRCDVGTMAEIGDAAHLSDGRWVIIAIGTGRIRVVEWLPDDPYPLAVVEDVDDTGASAGPQVRDRIEALVHRTSALLTELGEAAPPIDTPLAPDPLAAAHQAIALLPVAALDAQRVLETDDPDQRIDLVLTVLADLTDLLEMRLQG